MKKPEALRLALEALEMSRRFVYADNRPQCDGAVDALRAALAQQADKPQRPKCFEFALDFLGTPENGELLAYIEQLEARTALAQQDEPVLVVEKEPDYWSGGHFHQGSKPHIDPTKVWSLPIGTKLYTAPPQRKPLTQEEIDRICVSLGFAAISPVEITRAVERAHGIGEQP